MGSRPGETDGEWIRLGRAAGAPLLVLLVALLTRLAMVVGVAHGPEWWDHPDAGGFTTLARALLEWGEYADTGSLPFSSGPWRTDLFRPPAYPVLLAGIFAVVGWRPWAAIAVQVVMGAATAAVTVLLGRELRLPARVATGAGLLVALDPVNVGMVTVLLADTLFGLTLVLAAWLLARGRRAGHFGLLAGAGIALAAAALARPVAQFLPALAAPLAWSPRLARRAPRLALMGSLLLLVCGTLPLVGWAWRNEREAGYFGLSTVSDHNLLQYRAAVVLALAEGRDWGPVRQELQAAADASAPPGAIDVARYGRGPAIAILRAHPRETALVTVVSAVTVMLDPTYGRDVMSMPLWRAIGTPGARALATPGEWRFYAAYRLALVALWLLALGGAIRLAICRRWWALALLAGVAVYVVALSAGYEATGRFRAPIMPFLALLAASGADALAGVVACKVRWMRMR